MGQVLFIAVFAAFFLWDSAPRPWFDVGGSGLIAAISTGSMAVLWAISAVLIWRLGRRMDRHGDLRAVGRCDSVLSATRVIGVAMHAVNVLGLGWLDVVREWM